MRDEGSQLTDIPIAGRATADAPPRRRAPVRSHPSVVVAALILITLSVGWIGCGYRLINIMRYSDCCGAGVTWGPGPIVFSGYACVVGSLATIVGGLLVLTRGDRAAGWFCWSVSLIAVLWGAGRVMSPWPGPDSFWAGRYIPGWFSVLMQDWPGLIGGLIALVLLVTSPILRRSRG